MKDKKQANATKKDPKKSKSSGMKLTNEDTKPVKGGGFRPVIRHAAW